jgi:hypothetical protein
MKNLSNSGPRPNGHRHPQLAFILLSLTLWAWWQLIAAFSEYVSHDP